MRLLVLMAAAVLLSGCTSDPTNSKSWIEPVDAIRAANDDPSNGVRGEFIITVKALDSYPDQSFLDSEKDYRDQRNLTVRMPTAVVPKMEQRLGVKFQDLKISRIGGLLFYALPGGTKDFIADGKPTGKYYYQTHVHVDSPTQITFAE